MPRMQGPHWQLDKAGGRGRAHWQLRRQRAKCCMTTVRLNELQVLRCKGAAWRGTVRHVALWRRGGGGERTAWAQEQLRHATWGRRGTQQVPVPCNPCHLPWHGMWVVERMLSAVG